MPEDGNVYLEIAKAVRAKRPVFEKLYDAVIDPFLPDALQFRALSKVRERAEQAADPGRPALTGLDRDCADFAAALRQADDVHVLPTLLARGAGQLFGEAALPRIGATLQAVTNVREVFHHTLQLTSGRMTALLRMCRIGVEQENDDPVRGSGFLIGPNLVLTNWHVVKSMIDGGREQPKSETKMVVEFDVLLRADGTMDARSIKRYRPVERWLVAAGEADPQEAAAGRGSADSSPWPAQPDDLYAQLDFAVVELDGTPGYERGWYALQDARWPQAGTALDLYQFPLGRPMVTMPGTFIAPAVFRDTDKPARILHDANTTRGSSGGLCLDLESRPVALHQAGYVFAGTQVEQGGTGETATLNAAIPLPLVARAASAKVQDRIDGAPRQKRLTGAGSPILGRRSFQALVDEAIRGTVRIIIVQPPPEVPGSAGKLGKTFSADILRALVPNDHIVFDVSAARLTSEAFGAAALIAAAVGKPLEGKLPARPSGQTSLDAEATGALADAVASSLSATAGAGVLWLVIDDLDRFPVQTETTAATFLDALYKRAGADPRLRVVLIGPSATLPGLTGLLAKADLILGHVTPDELGSWLTAEVNARVPILPEVGAILTSIVASQAAEAARLSDAGLTKALADMLRTHWRPALERKA